MTSAEGLRAFLVAGGGANPFPGAVAGVYGPVDDAAGAVVALTGKANGSVAFNVAGAIWYTVDGVTAVRIVTPAIASPAALPSPVSGETFAEGSEDGPALACFVINPGVMYRWNGSGWDA